MLASTILFDNYGTANWGLRICNITIKTVEEFEAEKETKRAELNDLLKMDSADSLALFTTNNGYGSNNAAFNEAAAANLTSGASVSLSTYHSRTYTLDLGFLYTLGEIYSISITYGAQCYKATAGTTDAELSVTVNGVNKIVLANMWNTQKLKSQTLTITADQLYGGETGLLATDGLEQFVFATNKGIMLYVEDITIVTVAEHNAQQSK